MKNILGLITAAALISVTCLPYAASAEAAASQQAGKFTCKMITRAQLDAEDKVASAKALAATAKVSLERHRNATELSELLTAQAYLNLYVAQRELAIATEQHKDTVALKKEVATLQKRFDTITTNLPKLEKNESKALQRYEAAQEELDKAQAALAKIGSCSTRVITPKPEPIPFPVPKEVVAKAALDKAQAAYDQASEALRKEELSYSEAKYERALADVEYMLAEAKSKVHVRLDLAKKADMIYGDCLARAIMAGIIYESTRLDNEYVHLHSKKQSQIKESDESLKFALAVLEKCAEQLGTAKQLSWQAHADLKAALAMFLPARDNFANAQLRLVLASDQLSFTRAQKETAKSELAKAKAAFDQAVQQQAK